MNLLVGEWIPFGANQIVALNERLGAYDRCKGGMFTSKPDTDPTGNSLELDPGLTQVDILDFDHTEYGHCRIYVDCFVSARACMQLYSY